MINKKRIIGLIIVNIIGLIIIGIPFCFDLSNGQKNIKASKNLFPIILKNNKWTYMNSKGNIAMGKKFDCTTPFSEGMAAAEINGRFGYINKNGNFIIKPQYSFGSQFKCGRAAICKESKWGFIDKRGKIIIKPQYNIVGDFSDGLACVFMHKKKSGNAIQFIDRYGKIKLDTTGKKYECKLKSYFSDGLLPVEINNKYGYINKKGKIVIKPTYKDAQSFSEGLAAVCTGDGWGFINKKGKFVIKPQYPGVTNFSEGIAIVNLGIYIDELTELKYNINSMLGFDAFKIYTMRFINKKGDVLFEISNKQLSIRANELDSKFYGGLCGFIIYLKNVSQKQKKVNGAMMLTESKDKMLMQYIDNKGNTISVFANVSRRKPLRS